jgi:hypothetical protein
MGVSPEVTKDRPGSNCSISATQRAEQHGVAEPQPKPSREAGGHNIILPYDDLA